MEFRGLRPSISGQAATRVNAKHVLNLIKEIPQSHACLAKALTNLVHDFSFEEIITLTNPR